MPTRYIKVTAYAYVVAWTMEEARKINSEVGNNKIDIPPGTLPETAEGVFEKTKQDYFEGDVGLEEIVDGAWIYKDVEFELMPEGFDPPAQFNEKVRILFQESKE